MGQDPDLAPQPSAAAAGAQPPQPSQMQDARAILIAKRERESSVSNTQNQTLGEQWSLSSHTRM